ncbi:MAG: ATP-binding protein [Ramlibacter sp.]
MSDVSPISLSPPGLSTAVGRDVLRRYGLALALPVLALLLRASLPVPEGTAIYQLPLAAVVLSAWYGGRGPGLLASVICITGVWYWFIPPTRAWEISPDHALGLSIFIALCVLLSEFGAARWRIERALKDSEQQLRLMAETVPGVLWSASAGAARLLYMTPRYEQVWGRTLGDLERDPEAWMEAVHPDQRGEVRAGWTRWLAGHASDRLDVTFRIVRPDGETRWIHNRGILVRDGRGRPLRGSGIAADITEERRTQEAVASAQAELARVSRRVTTGELTASIAHEVNQPLAAMVANAAACLGWLAAEPAETQRARQALERIVADGQRASQVIGRIRALVDRQPPRKGPVDINQTVLHTVELAAQELRSNGIVLATRLSEGLPPVLGDGIQLQQVLLNLIMNAIEAMSAFGERPGRLEIATRDAGAGTVLVEVRDTGPGLASGQEDRIFEAFYTTKPTGLGIGLSISRSIIAAHGGRLGVASNEPHGAVFRFTLPAQEGAGA